MPAGNSQILYTPQDQYYMDNRAAFANGAAGSVAPMNVFIARLRKSMAQDNIYERFMRAGQSSPISFEKRPGANEGYRATLRILGTLGGVGRRGDLRFSLQSHFGKIPLAAMNIDLSKIRNATGITEHGEEMMGTGGQISAEIPTQLGKWGGRQLQGDIDMVALHRCAGSSRMFNGNKTSHATLVSADTCSYDIIGVGSETMQAQGGVPFYAGRQNNGEEYWNMMALLPPALSRGIKRDANYQLFLQNAAVRGEQNPYFTGEITQVDGNTIVKRNLPVEQGQVKTGCPFAPIAYLGVAHLTADPVTATPSTTPLTGGGTMYDSTVTDTPWFADFPGYDYPLTESDTVTAAAGFWGSGPYYALVVNPRTAALDPGKMGMISYTVPAGANTIIMVNKLTAATSAAGKVTAIGTSVTAVGLFAGIFTENYAVNATIIPCNAKGCPIAVAPLWASNAVGFVRGGSWGELFYDRVEGGSGGKQVFAGWTYGLAPYITPFGHTPGLLMIGCAASYPALGLPNVT